MGRPSIDFVFQTAARNTIAFGDKGVLAMILRDSSETGAHTIRFASHIPTALSAANQDTLSLALKGYVNPPKSILLYVLPIDAELSEALAHFETQQFDYLTLPPDATQTEANATNTWILAQRAEKHMVKAVLPNCAADSEAIINFTSEGMTDGSQIYTAADYCARIAGILAGTPWTMSATYAPLSELTGVTNLSGEDADNAIDAGQLILEHDGRKVKISRAVNSLQSTTETKGDIFKKIKIVEVIDRIYQDLTAAIEDGYIGKFSNSYDNKMLLVAACRQYFYDLETAGIAKSGSTSADLDTDATRQYLEKQGTDTSEMTEEELRQADTGSHVYLAFNAKILDAIEDVTGKINL